MDGALGERLLPVAAALLLFFLAFGAPAGQERSDARFSLLVSQALLEQGTVRLDGYAERLALDDGYQIIRHEGHDYYYFPLGASVVALPFVWAANRAGLDMATLQDDVLLQNLLSSFTVVAVFLVGYRIATLFLRPLPALLTASATVLGSSLLSTMATAFWNVDVAVLFICLSLWLLLRAETVEKGEAHPVWLGVFLFLAYLSRPTTAIFVGIMLGYLLLQKRRLFLRTSVVAGGLFLFHLFFNEAIYGQLLSPYTAISRFAPGEAEAMKVLGGLLFSPSRGFFIFHPHFFLVLAGALLLLWKGRRRRLQLALMLWITLTVVLVSTFPHWWGGWPYGPRLLTEIIPAFFVLAPLVALQAAALRSSHLLRASRALYAVAVLGAIFIHAFQGLYNESTAEWNGPMAPNIDDYPVYLFDWKYPQFLATNRALCARNEEHLRALLAQRASPLEPVHPGDQLGHDVGAERALFIGWSAPEADFRWSACPVVHLLFRPMGIDPGSEYRLTVTAGSFAGQRVTLLLNGERLGEMSFPPSIVPPVERNLTASGERLRPETVNELTILIPGARSFPSRCGRRLGLSFSSLKLEQAP